MDEFQAATIRKINELQATCMAQDILFNVVFRYWGAPATEVMEYLDECVERAEASGLPMPRPEAELDAIRKVLQQARLALVRRSAEHP